MRQSTPPWHPHSRQKMSQDPITVLPDPRNFPLEIVPGPLSLLFLRPCLVHLRESPSEPSETAPLAFLEGRGPVHLPRPKSMYRCRQINQTLNDKRWHLRADDV